MTLSLPADLEPFITDEFAQIRGPGVYALDLERPADPAAAWDDRFETRPEWWPSFIDSRAVIYVGATSDVLRRLEEHRDGEVRRATLLEICDIAGVRDVWWFSDKQRAFERERGIALALQHDHPAAYVHCR